MVWTVIEMGLLIAGVVGVWMTVTACRCRRVDVDLDVPPAQVVHGDDSPIVVPYRRRLDVGYGRLGLGMVLLFVGFLGLVLAIVRHTA